MNNRGSVSLFMILFLPVILTALALAFAGAMSLQMTEKTNLICRESILEAEDQMLSQFNKLSSLNPTAKILREADTTSKLTMFIPIYGEVSAASVQEARIIFHTLQFKIIQSANLEMKMALSKLKTELNSSYSFGSTGFVQAEILNSPFLAVEPKPRTNLTPDYYAKKDFENLMLSQVRWTIQIEKILPVWLKQLLAESQFQLHKYDLDLNCAASLTKNEQALKSGDSQWQTTLIEKNRIQSQIIRAKQLLSLF